MNSYILISACEYKCCDGLHNVHRNLNDAVHVLDINFMEHFYYFE